MLIGKTIVITGVSSGIGAQTAELALAQGAEVFGVDVRDPEQVRGTFIRGDLSSTDSIAALVRKLPHQIDALLNIAGISGRGGAEATLAVNFYGLRHLSEELAQKISSGGSITSVASIAGYGWRENLEQVKALVGIRGFPDINAIAAQNHISADRSYPLSKELLLLWTQLAAHQTIFKGNGIRVNAVSPGPVETPILSEFRLVLGAEKFDSDIEKVGRAGKPSDIAPVLLFLASDEARWINGANIACDGGLEASINADVLSF